MPDVGLLTPGVAAGDPDDVALVRALLRAEAAWAHALESASLAKPGAGDAVDSAAASLVEDNAKAALFATGLAAGTALTGNPILGVVAALRDALPPEHQDVVHRGLTSQDVMDTALMLIVKDAAAVTDAALAAAGRSLADLATLHRSTRVLARTLGQAALPTTLGARIASWIQALAEARLRLEREANDAPVAFGGAAGTLAGTGNATGQAAAEPIDLVNAWAATLGLATTAGPWHVTRFPVQRLAGALAEVCAAGGKLAADVLAASRPEVGELREHAEPGKGASTAMPFKANPVLSIAMRRCAIAAPHALAQVHTAAGLAVDERPDGAWHAEWSALRSLARDAVVCATSAAALAKGLEVNVEAAARNLAAHHHGDPSIGSAELLVDRVLNRYGYGD